MHRASFPAPFGVFQHIIKMLEGCGDRRGTIGFTTGDSVLRVRIHRLQKPIHPRLCWHQFQNESVCEPVFLFQAVGVCFHGPKNRQMA